MEAQLRAGIARQKQEADDIVDEYARLKKKIKAIDEEIWASKDATEKAQ